MMLNPKYAEKNLLGLTTAQVIQRLGSPHYDSRQTDPQSPVYLTYDYAGVGRTIEFDHDKVVSVWWDRK